MALQAYLYLIKPITMRSILIGGLIVILCGCGPQKIVTTWKTKPDFPERYRKILVVTVLPVSDTMLRRTIEGEAVNTLSGYGYDAISALSTFGPKGLIGEGEEATYLKLCNSGIDAVITFALVPKAKVGYYDSPGQYVRTNNYYYDRIWAYKRMQADMADDSPEDEYYWESVLFDLLTLQAVTTLRTGSFARDNQQEFTENLVSLVIRKMRNEKVISKKSPNLKPF